MGVQSRDLSTTASAAELAYWIQKGELSPTELMRATLTRIERTNPSVNAFVHLAAEEALMRAAAQEVALRRGEDLGPLAGIPVAMKDLYDFKAGWPSTLGGIPALRHNIASTNTFWVERMERAGAIIIGKTNAPSLGFRGTCDNPLFGVSNNPFDLRFNSGGSSGGAAAAVACKLVAIAQATDGGGSTRIPAAFCGLFGLKPSYGRIAMPVRPNAFGGVSPFLSDGVVTRTVADSMLAFKVLEGYDPRDPFVSAVPKLDDSLLRGDVAGLRVAFSPNLDSYPVESEIARLVARAVRVFEDAGAIVEEVRLGFSADHFELGELWCRLIVQSQIEALEELKTRGIDILGKHPNDLSDRHRRWIDAVLASSMRERTRDQLLRTMVYEKIQACLDRYDLLITPTTACLGIQNQPGASTIGPSEIDGVPVEPLVGWALTSYFNFTGHPAASVPAGLSSSGLPIGMQIAAKRFDDAAVLNAALFVEQAMPWSGNYERIVAS